MIEETNVTIAELLLQQTYSERLEFAGWLAGNIDNSAPPTTIDFDAGECIDAGECGCVAAAAVRSLKQGERE
jgi:hypothetical protein